MKRFNIGDKVVLLENAFTGTGPELEPGNTGVVVIVEEDGKGGGLVNVALDSGYDASWPFWPSEINLIEEK